MTSQHYDVLHNIFDGYKIVNLYTLLQFERMRVLHSRENVVTKEIALKAIKPFIFMPFLENTDFCTANEYGQPSELLLKDSRVFGE